MTFSSNLTFENFHQLTALADKLPLLKSDFSKPMLRFDLVIDVPSRRSVGSTVTRGGVGGAVTRAMGTLQGVETHQVVVELYVAPLKGYSYVILLIRMTESCHIFVSHVTYL